MSPQENSEILVDQGAQGQSDRKSDLSALKTIIEVKEGRLVWLPCKCTRWNNGGNKPPRWQDNHGRDIVLKGPEIDKVSLQQWK